MYSELRIQHEKLDEVEYEYGFIEVFSVEYEL